MTRTAEIVKAIVCPKRTAPSRNIGMYTSVVFLTIRLS